MRIRTIKPEFWENEDLAGVSEAACLLAIGLLNMADDEGYFKAHERLIMSAVFPIREPSVSAHAMLSELSGIDYIRLFTGTDGKTYGHVRTFLTHQRVNRPTPSKIAPLDSLSTHGALTAGKEGKGKEGRGSGSGSETTATASVVDPYEYAIQYRLKGDDPKTFAAAIHSHSLTEDDMARIRNAALHHAKDQGRSGLPYLSDFQSGLVDLLRAREGEG